MVGIPGYQIRERPGQSQSPAFPATVGAGDPVYESERSVVYQGIRQSDEQPVILKLLKQDGAGLNEVARFRSEYELARSLQGNGIIEVYGLEFHQNQWVMVMEDFGGESLAESLAKSLIKVSWPSSDGSPAKTPHQGLKIEEFLRVAIRVTEALEQLHQQNIMHKDINPSNILYNSQTGQVKLIDFGISTALSRETSSGLPLTILEGTLPYMSPEQTGRMNRSMDYRTDLYSLGATFYKLLTGQMPFPAEDAMELIHCHLAKMPTPPHQLNQEIPILLSEIVLKLMAKHAEDRYQSTFGLKADLEACLAQLNTTESLASFHVGGYDISDRFQIPQKLYGRQQEIDTLLKAFDRVSRGAKEMVVVTGYAGIGKSTLVHEIHKPIVEKQGYFISGKFDQLKRDVSFACLIHALQGLVGQLLSESESQVKVWKQKLLEAFGVNGRVIIDVIPEVELIIGPQPPLADLPRTESQNRFNYVFQRFIRALNSSERPLTIFLDDLQWADPASLHLLELFMSDNETTEGRTVGPASAYQPHQRTDARRLFLIVAYRDNEIDASHPLFSMLEEIQKEGTVIHTISLSPLSLETVNQLIADTLKSTPSQTQGLAQICFEKTQGNPFFLGEFLHSLHAEGLIEFDSAQRQWQWEVEAVRQADITDNVVELMASKMQKLSEANQQILKLAACLGNQFELQTLSFIYEHTSRETVEVLRDVLQEGLILELQATRSNPNNKQSRYKFSHDRIQEAAYSLIEETEKASIHLKIGRLLLKYTSAEELEENPFEIVSHWNKALHLIEEDAERRRFSELSLRAGQKAKKTQAYSAAVTHLKIGIALLSEATWRSDYAFLFTLHVELAEAHYLNTDFEAADPLYSFLLEKASNDQDLCRVYFIQLEQLMMERKLEEAIEVASHALRILGIEVPHSETEISQFFDKELAALPHYLAGRKIAALARETKKSSQQEERQLILLSSLSTSAYNLSKNQLLEWTALKEAALCLQNGHNEIAAISYITYASSILVKLLKDYKNAYEYGKMAVALSENYGNLSYKGRTYYRFAIYINPLKNSLSKSLTFLRKAIQFCTEGGDFLFAGYAIGWLLMYQIISGQEPSKIHQELEKYIQFIKRTNPGLFERALRPVVLQVLKNLVGTTTPGTFSDPEGSSDTYFGTHSGIFSEQGFLQKNWPPMTFAFFYCAKIRSLTLFGQYKEALAYLDKVKRMVQDLPGIVFIAETYFYMSLTLTAILAEGTLPPTDTPTYPLQKKGEKRQAEGLPRQYHQVLETYQTEMRSWAEHAPANFEHKYLLVEAERAKLTGQLAEAMRLYKQGIASAKKYEFLNMEALGNELYTKFWLENDEAEYALIHMLRAHALYRQWGATGKVRQLERNYPQLLRSLVPTSTEGIHSGSSSRNGSRTVGALDLEAIIKASQALSEEINLEKLLGRLLRIIIENAGAQKGLLLLKKEDILLIEGFIDAEKNTVRVQEETPQEWQLPLSIVRFVTRTGESVRIDEEPGWHNFSQDPYFAHIRPQAILCIPLKKKERMDGVLYLENDITSGVFTEDRIQMLETLLSQATISIENARLFTTLAEQKEEVQKHRDHLEELVQQRTYALEKAFRQIHSDLQMAGEFQQSVLPPIPQIPFLKTIIKYDPLDQVSGDVYDMYIDQEGALNVFLGDATGHGIAAAFMTMMVHIGLDTLKSEEPPVNEILSKLNQILLPRAEGKFVTGVFLKVTPDGQLSTSNAGHPSLLVLPADGSEIVEIKQGGTPLGVFKSPYQMGSYQLQEGDQFFVYTDGWYEWPNKKNKMFKYERFRRFFEDNRGTDLETMLNRLTETLKQFSQGEPCNDDMTILGFQYIQATNPLSNDAIS